MNRQITFKEDRSTGVKDSEPYLQKLLKLIPTETIAVYIFIDGLLKSALKDDVTQLQWWLWISLIIIAVGNIYYLFQTLKVSDWVQYVIMTFAFLVWIFTIGGPFSLLSWYQPFMGSVILALFTFLVPKLYNGVQI